MKKVIVIALVLSTIFNIFQSNEYSILLIPSIILWGLVFFFPAIALVGVTSKMSK